MEAGRGADPYQLCGEVASWPTRMLLKVESRQGDLSTYRADSGVTAHMHKLQHCSVTNRRKLSPSNGGLPKVHPKVRRPSLQHKYAFLQMSILLSAGGFETGLRACLAAAHEQLSESHLHVHGPVAA